MTSLISTVPTINGKGSMKLPKKSKKSDAPSGKKVAEMRVDFGAAIHKVMEKTKPCTLNRAAQFKAKGSGTTKNFLTTSSDTDGAIVEPRAGRRAAATWRAKEPPSKQAESPWQLLAALSPAIAFGLPDHRGECKASLSTFNAASPSAS